MLVKSQCLLAKISPILSVKSHLFGLNQYVLDGVKFMLLMVISIFLMVGPPSVIVKYVFSICF